MGQRNIWEEIFALEIFNTGTSLSSIVSGSPVFDASTTKGVRGIFGTGANTVYNLLPTEHSEIKAQAGSIKHDLVTGKSIDNVVSYTSVTTKPENAVIPVLYNSNNLSAFFKLWCQSGVTVANGTTNTALQIMTCVPYTDTQPTVFGNLIKFMQDSGETDPVDQLLKGVLIKRINIKGEEGGVIDGELEYMGAKRGDGNYAGSSGTGALAKSKPFDSITPLKFEDLTVILGGQTISVPKFDITFENNAFSHYYNETSAKALNLGKIDVTGTLTVPWNDTTSEGKNKQITDFISGIDKTLEFVWGNPTGGSGAVDVLAANAKNQVSNNYFSIRLNIRISDYTQNDIDGLPMIEASFAIVEDEANTNSTMTVQIGYDKTKNLW